MALVVLVVLLARSSSVLVRLLSLGFRDPATWAESTRLAEILVISILFSVLAVILGVLQNVYRRQPRSSCR